MSTNTSSLHVFHILRLVAESQHPLGVAEIAKLRVDKGQAVHSTLTA